MSPVIKLNTLEIKKKKKITLAETNCTTSIILYYNYEDLLAFYTASALYSQQLVMIFFFFLKIYLYISDIVFKESLVKTLKSKFNQSATYSSSEPISEDLIGTSWHWWSARYWSSRWLFRVNQWTDCESTGAQQDRLTDSVSLCGRQVSFGHFCSCFVSFRSFCIFSPSFILSLWGLFLVYLL